MVNIIIDSLELWKYAVKYHKAGVHMAAILSDF